MKFIRNIAFAAIASFAAFSMVTYTACNKDECKDVTCNNGGTCINGNCSCPTGYEGSKCEIVSAASLPGVYTATEDCQPPLTGGPSSWSSTVSTSSSDETRIVISNFGNSSTNVTAQVDKNAITIDATTIGTRNVTGTGTVNGSTLTINYQLSGTPSYSCTMTMTLQ